MINPKPIAQQVLDLGLFDTMLNDHEQPMLKIQMFNLPSTTPNLVPKYIF
jgi:hypothetical protein